MPPAAISRSSTYLPKIWGNIARPHGSALGLALLLSGCFDPVEDQVLPIRAHRPDGCGTGDTTTIQLDALGDFEASALTSETVTSASGGSADLSFPPNTLAIEARAEGAASTFLGVGERNAAGGIDVLLLPEDSACELYRPSSSKPYPLAAGGEAIGFSRAHRRLLVAGGISPSGDSARALVVNVDTGASSEVPDGMIPGRAFSTITELGDDALLVAGGIDPSIGSAETSPALGTAIVYDISEVRFDRTNLIQLARPRARHAAVLLESGETLLVGGETVTADPELRATTALDAVSPVDRAARAEGFAALKDARITPAALRLDDGRVFVGGGVDDGGAAVQSLEWLSPTAADHLHALSDVRVAAASAFAALPGGAVLAVGVCRPGASNAERPECVPGRISRQVSWIRSDYTVDALEPLPFAPGSPALVPAADGAPFLIATRPDGVRVVLRFDPWSARFVSPEEAPLAPSALHPPLATDPGMFVWLSAFGDALRVDAFRHGTRGTYSRDIAPFFLTGPGRLAPDRAPGNDSAVRYTGTLELHGSESEPAARVTLPDTTYDSVRVEIVLELPSALPRIALGQSVFGDTECPWPAGSDEQLVLRRSGSTVTLERGAESASCAIGTGRVAIAVLAPRGAENDARVTSLRVSRDSG